LSSADVDVAVSSAYTVKVRVRRIFKVSVAPGSMLGVSTVTMTEGVGLGVWTARTAKVAEGVIVTVPVNGVALFSSACNVYVKAYGVSPAGSVTTDPSEETRSVAVGSWIDADPTGGVAGHGGESSVSVGTVRVTRAVEVSPRPSGMVMARMVVAPGSRESQRVSVTVESAKGQFVTAGMLSGSQLVGVVAGQPDWGCARPSEVTGVVSTLGFHSVEGSKSSVSTPRLLSLME
jgi:hypothetical protein